MSRVIINKASNIVYIVILFFVIMLGFYLRIKLFLLNPGIHHDEANLALNMIEHSYFDLFKPLDRNQVCPPFFLIVSKFIYNLVNFNYCARFSDMLLKVFPLISGLAVVPLFTLFLDSIFHNKSLNILGTMFLALNKYAVYYSCVFKQYSLEMLVALVLMLIIYNIDLKNEKQKTNTIIFFLIGFVPLLSISSYFILAGVVFYLAYLYLKTREKIYVEFILLVSLPALLLVFLIYYPAYALSRIAMYKYWTAELGLNFPQFIGAFFYKVFHKFKFNFLFLPITAVISMGIIIKNNLKLFFIMVFPFILTYLAGYFSFYPAEIRLLLFIFPILIVILLYLFSLVKFLNNGFATLIVCCFISLYLIIFINKSPSPDIFILKPDMAREVWEYFSATYDNSTPVIFAGSKNSQNYYNKFFVVKKSGYVFSDDINWSELYNAIPSGTYYIVSDLSKSYNLLLKKKLLADTKIIQYKFFISPWIKSKNKYGWYMKFTKY